MEALANRITLMTVLERHISLTAMSRSCLRNVYRG
jgi:hypothetical protein